MFEFYEFNTLNIIIVLISTFIIYYILNKCFNIKNINNKNKNDKETKFSFEFLCVSAIISICISLLVAYVIANNEEDILMDNYWDPINISNDSNIDTNNN